MTAQTMPTDLRRQIADLIGEAERLAPRLTKLAGAYEQLNRETTAWEKCLPPETDEQLTQRGLDTGEARLDDLMQAIVCVANVTPHEPEDHEFGVNLLGQLGLRVVADDEQTRARRHLARFDAWLKEEAPRARNHLTWAMHSVRPGWLDDEDAKKVTNHAAWALAFIYRIILELEQETGWAFDQIE